jgi:hypothetical protein
MSVQRFVPVMQHIFALEGEKTCTNIFPSQKHACHYQNCPVCSDIVNKTGVGESMAKGFKIAYDLSHTSKGSTPP